MNQQEQIERMIALCEAATRGPWRIHSHHFIASGHSEGQHVATTVFRESGRANAAYIAAHSPDLVAALWRVVAAADSVRQHGDIESGRMMTDALDALWQRMEERGE